MAANFLYMTASNHHEAASIAEVLISERLVACVNILPGIQSIYRWNGEIARDDEVAVIMKTRAELVAAVTDRVKQLHSYDCPCIVALEISGGNAAFLSWITAETTDADPGGAEREN